MADPTEQPPPSPESSEGDAGSADDFADFSGDAGISIGSDQEVLWSQVWQLPVLLLGLGLVVIGVYVSLPNKGADDFAGRLANVETFIQNNKLQEAEDILELELEPRIHEAGKDDLAYFWQLFGDLTFQRLYKTGVVGRQGVVAAEPIYQKIVRYYGKSRENGRELSGPSLRYYIQSLVALGRDKPALALLEQMTGPQAAQRYLIVRDMIVQRRGDRQDVDVDGLIPLIKRFRKDIKAITDPAVAREQEIWADGFQASLQMQVGDPKGAIYYLLRRIQRLAASKGDDDLAPLIVLLGKAYLEIGDFRNSEQQFRYAQQKLKATDDLNADVLVGLGRLALTQATGQNVQEALEYFREAEEGYPSSGSSHIEALIGRGECESRLGSHAAGHRYFDLAVRAILERTHPWDRRRAEASTAIRTQFERAVDQDSFDRAKDYLDVLALLEGDDPSPQLLLDLASTCQRIAEQRREEAKLSAERAPGQQPLSEEGQRLANQQSAEYYAKAARYYYQHAGLVTIEDNEMHGKSLWNTAINFDNAQMWSKAIRVYEQFIQTRDGDPKRLRAITRLARAYMANREFKPALAQFQKLVEDYPRSPETFSSLVPMALCLDQLGQAQRAVATLEQVVDDHEAITPDSGEYREALIELGLLHHRMGEKDATHYARGIELLTEAVQRYGESDRGSSLRFLLGDSYRRSVPDLDEQIATTQARAAQLDLEYERKDRLERAQVLYNQAINGLEAKRSAQGGVLSPIEKLYLRNAYFYQADCAYDRGVFEQAIQLYNTAANNYNQDPASLVSLVQIVNANCELGRFQDAKIANDMARMQLERIPDEAFNDQNLPMKREHWEDWLRWTSERDLFNRRPSAGGG